MWRLGRAAPALAAATRAPATGVATLSRQPRACLFCTSSGGYEASVAARIREALQAQECQVTDRSGGCGQSFAINVEAEQFRGKTMLQRQRMVQAAIKDEIAKWHAVTINTKVPEVKA